MTIGVVIGDSIAQGSDAFWGRLNVNGVVDLDYPNYSGQFSGEFSRLFGFYWYNHGIAGQSSVQVLARWNRDVLGQTYDPGDGKGNSTLPQKADYVYIHIGVNDGSLTVAQREANYTNMLTSCKDNNINVVMSNIPFSTLMTSEQRADVVTVNSWLKNNVQTLCPGAVLFDEYSWSVDANISTKTRADYYPDGIHPYGGSLRKNGYQVLAQMIYYVYSGKIAF